MSIENTYSQNFLVSRSTVSKLVRMSSISKDDIVIDIGAGEGSITQELARRAKKVIAIENDKSLFERLEKIFKGKKNVNLYNIDINKFVYPSFNFKVFANIPFNLTSKILKGLLDSRHFKEVYLITQLDAVFRYTGEYTNSENTLLSTLYGAYYEFDIFHRFALDDFVPTPRYKCVMIKILRKDKELIEFDHYNKYRDYIAYIFNNVKGLQKMLSRKMIAKLIYELGYDKELRVSTMSIKQHTDLFNYIMQYSPNVLSVTRSSYAKYLATESKNIKIFRTRRDKSWREK